MVDLRNLEQAEKMYSIHAVLFGDREGVPLFVAEDTLGFEAVHFVRKLNADNRGLINGYGIGNFTAEYLTKRGFMTAVTFLNVNAIRLLCEDADKEDWSNE